MTLLSPFSGAVCRKIVSNLVTDVIKNLDIFSVKIVLTQIS